MRIWGISDLHLSFSCDKPMHVFGEHWQGHDQKMAASWDASVGADDVVLCPGDLSWALKLPEAALDLAWIAARKGRLKILTRGNHDYWWSAIGKVRSALPETLVALPAWTGELSRVFPVLARAHVDLPDREPELADADPQEIRRRAFAALRELLARIAVRRSLIVWIDDLHWGDLDSVPFLRDLLRPPDQIGRASCRERVYVLV